jgi:hypothetical protein
MMQKIINEKMSVESAQEWAQAEMMDAYNKQSKKA